MKYIKTRLDTPLTVDGIYTVHYFEYTKDFAFSGELHDFWELVYADKKSLFITAASDELELKTGQLYLHRPNEFHNIRCDGKSASNSAIISFDCACPELMSVAGMPITVGADERALIGNIIREATDAFATPLGSPYTVKMEKSETGRFGCEQLIKLCLEQLLILLIRSNRRTVTFARSDNDRLLSEICAYLESNVGSSLHFGNVTNHFNISASVIKKLFREHMDCGVMEFYTRLKIDAAKEKIREGNYNYTQIADSLAFNSSQYFTTVFRRVSGMTPTEYANSVKSNFEIYRQNM